MTSNIAWLSSWFMNWYYWFKGKDKTYDTIEVTDYENKEKIIASRPNNEKSGYGKYQYFTHYALKIIKK